MQPTATRSPIKIPNFTRRTHRAVPSMPETTDDTRLTTDRIALAARLINNTGRHIFLTGKAGTGKTTFLHNLARATHKNCVTVAPTGIAALNAGGVTIHSQFLLPFGSFIPGDNPQITRAGAFYTRHDLARRHPLNSPRKKVLRSIDLLIIDEVSMLRADVLDAIDYRLRSVKGNYRQSFGGVQLLMIGDLYQLPPIVKDHEWDVLREHYKSAHFFESQGLAQSGFVYVELDKIFRQSDSRFIDVLNNLRNDTCTAEDLATLNAAYDPTAKTESGVITLTTHNRQAEAINKKELEALPETPQDYHAEVRGDFPENLYPLPEILTLKVGAQVMFVKNDTMEKRFYNGKIARVTKLDKDTVTVIPEDESREITIGMTSWENKKYSVSEGSASLEEEVVGTFTQFPLKTAWAITVHKSQGLTFDKAVIDVGQAFAPGQVYVALSRLRSLEGLRLRTKINPAVISNDPQVVRFSGRKDSQPPLSEVLREAQREYLREALKATFDFSDMLNQLQYAMQKMHGKLDFEDAEMNIAMAGLHTKILGENTNTNRFRSQITRLLADGDYPTLRERIAKGSAYYIDFLKECNFYLLKHLGEVEMLSRTKTYTNLLAEIDQLMSRQIGELLKADHVTACISEDREVDRNPKIEEKRKAMREAMR
ncbi:MAG: ATP-dependent RecD-like DNA helicase, partial [Cryomorphaceae bacterium]